MGRARLLTSLIGNASLAGRVSSLETRVNVLEAAMDAVNSTLGPMSQRLDDAEAQVAAAIAAVSGVVNRPSVWRSPIDVDNFTTVPIGTGSQTFWRTINHVDVFNVKAGDKFLVFCQGNVRCDYDFNVEVAAWLSWTSPPGPLAHDGTGHTNVDYYLTGANTRSSVNHYAPWVRVGARVFTQDYASVRFHSSVRCRSSVADGSGTQTVTVGTWQGGITAIKLN